VRWLSLLLAVAATGLGAWAGWLWLSPSRDRPSLVVEGTQREFDALPVGVTQLVFRVTNLSDVPARIIGLEEG
jgi:hypothetical protein